MSDVLVKDGCMSPIKPMNGRDYSLLELQTYVDGDVEFVYFENGKILVVDEDGKLKGKPVNHIATGWLNVAGYHDYICGSALLVDGKHIR